MADAKEIPNLLLLIVQSLVDKPDEVLLDTFEDGEATVFRVRVASDDVGKIIGRQGRTAQSLRIILSAIGLTHGTKVRLDIIEEN
jgi:predicted RNA-binding protein YlqC (UPF0109 family)